MKFGRIVVHVNTHPIDGVRYDVTLLRYRSRHHFTQKIAATWWVNTKRLHSSACQFLIYSIFVLIWYHVTLLFIVSSSYPCQIVLCFPPQKKKIASEKKKIVSVFDYRTCRRQFQRGWGCSWRWRRLGRSVTTCTSAHQVSTRYSHSTTAGLSLGSFWNTLEEAQRGTLRKNPRLMYKIVVWNQEECTVIITQRTCWIDCHRRGSRMRLELQGPSGTDWKRHNEEESKVAVQNLGLK